MNFKAIILRLKADLAFRYILDSSCYFNFGSHTYIKRYSNDKLANFDLQCV